MFFFFLGDKRGLISSRDRERERERDISRSKAIYGHVSFWNDFFYLLKMNFFKIIKNELKNLKWSDTNFFFKYIY